MFFRESHTHYLAQILENVMSISSTLNIEVVNLEEVSGTIQNFRCPVFYLRI